MNDDLSLIKGKLSQTKSELSQGRVVLGESWLSGDGTALFTLYCRIKLIKDHLDRHFNLFVCKIHPNSQHVKNGRKIIRCLN